jgi:hypothetical protein
MYELSAITERDQNGEKKSFFTRCGVAFPTKNGEGFILQFDALPVSGKVLMQPKREKQEAGL